MENIFYANGNEGKGEVVKLISDKIDLRTKAVTGNKGIL